MCFLYLDWLRRRRGDPVHVHHARAPLTVQGVLTSFEAFVTGYKWEHLALGLQMAICFILAVLPLIIQRM